MERASDTGGRLITAILIFTVSLFCTLLTGVAALILWLAARIGSLVTAAVVVCLFFAVLAIVSYLLSIRDAIARFRNELDTVYEVANRIRRGYRWIQQQFGWLIGQNSDSE